MAFTTRSLQVVPRYGRRMVAVSSSWTPTEISKYYPSGIRSLSLLTYFTSPKASSESSTMENPSFFAKRQLSISSSVPPEDDREEVPQHGNSISAAVPKVESNQEHQRVWLSHSLEKPMFWSEDVVQGSEENPHNLARLLDRIERQELEGGRMRSKQYGVLHEDPAVDMRLLTENYTVTSLAAALRDREDVLQYCAELAAENNVEALKEYLHMFHPNLVLQRRNQKRRLDVSQPLNATSLETIRKALMRMPRRVVQAHSRRAGVVIPIVHVDGVPSLLLEKRSPDLRAHPDEVCLPGGMVCNAADQTIVETCLREMKEEIGGMDFDYHQETGGGSHGVSVLGVLRCNWGEVHHMVGVAVTPVVCYFNQDLAEADLKPNPDEVAEVFTIPLASLLDRSQWVYKEDHAPIFIGGPYIIWGLTGFLLNRFTKDILLPFNQQASDNNNSLHIP